MCGIAGIIQSNPGRFQLSQLQQMTDAIAHRGPDGAGEWCNQNNTVLLGHRRLSIIDLSSAGEQPMHYLDRYSIVHNGEIYNYTELRNLLQQKGYQFRSQTDTEVIAAAWDYWKEDCLQHFDGMFAFAIWDQQEQELFAAVDRFGEKPFYYTLEEDALVFGSEMKALWAAGINKAPNLQMLFNFITIGYTSNPEKKKKHFTSRFTGYRPPAIWSIHFPISCWRFKPTGRLIRKKNKVPSVMKPPSASSMNYFKDLSAEECAVMFPSEAVLVADWTVLLLPPWYLRSAVPIIPARHLPPLFPDLKKMKASMPNKWRIVLN